MQSQFNSTIYDYEEICDRCGDVVDRIGMDDCGVAGELVCRGCAEEIELLNK